MSAPKNIQRDGTYADPSNARVTISSPTIAWVPRGNSDGNVHHDYGFVQYAYENQIAQPPNDGNGPPVLSLGVYMDPPHKDRHPYRVKVNVLAIDGRESREDPTFSLMIAFASEIITGTDDLLYLPTYIPLQNGMLDDMIVLEDVPTDHEYYGRPMYFGIAVHGETADCDLFAHISVQNLGIKPPTMQNAIS